MYWTWISPSISVGDFYKWNFWMELLSYFGQGVSFSISIQSWKIGCGKLKLDKWIFNSLLIVTYSGWTLPLDITSMWWKCSGTEINFKCNNFVVHLLEFGHFNLLALDKSILTIANYSRNWKLDQNHSTWFTDWSWAEHIRDTSPTCIHCIRGLSQLDGYGGLDIGTLDISFGDVDEWRTTSINQEFCIWSPFPLSHSTR